MFVTASTAILLSFASIWCLNQGFRLSDCACYFIFEHDRLVSIPRKFFLTLNTDIQFKIIAPILCVVYLFIYSI